MTIFFVSRADRPGSAKLARKVINMKNVRPIPKAIRAAIAAFLNECQREARPFASTEALGAIRTMFPHLDVTDADLEDAITSEAAEAGFEIDKGSGTGTKARSDAQRRINNDTDGKRRRREATKDRNQLI